MEKPEKIGGQYVSLSEGCHVQWHYPGCCHDERLQTSWYVCFMGVRFCRFGVLCQQKILIATDYRHFLLASQKFKVTAMLQEGDQLASKVSTYQCVVSPILIDSFPFSADFISFLTPLNFGPPSISISKSSLGANGLLLMTRASFAPLWRKKQSEALCCGTMHVPWCNLCEGRNKVKPCVVGPTHVPWCNMT